MAKPKEGSILYTDLRAVEHSGVWIGGWFGDPIVELNKHGEIKKVSKSKFQYGPRVYVACDEKTGNVLSASHVASAAKRFLDAGHIKNCSSWGDYNFLTNNCHSFTAACILNEKEITNANNFFSFLKDLIRNKLNNGNPIKWEEID